MRFHGTFVVQPGDVLLLMSKYCCYSPEPDLSGIRLSEDRSTVDMDEFLKYAKDHSFTLTSMTFMDSMNFDIERLMYCRLCMLTRRENLNEKRIEYGRASGDKHSAASRWA